MSSLCQCPSPGFTDNSLYNAINKRYLNFVQTRDFISLVNDNHVDNNVNKILVYAYYDSIVNNRPSPPPSTPPPPSHPLKKKKIRLKNKIISLKYIKHYTAGKKYINIGSQKGFCSRNIRMFRCMSGNSSRGIRKWTVSTLIGSANITNFQGQQAWSCVQRRVVDAWKQ